MKVCSGKALFILNLNSKWRNGGQSHFHTLGDLLLCL
jgi:hypothetical protein